MNWINGSEHVRLLLKDNRVVGCVYRDTRYAVQHGMDAWRANQDKDTLYLTEKAAMKAAEGAA
jgi:hypothetical protein